MFSYKSGHFVDVRPSLVLTVGQWCLVDYDGELYPGEVKEVDDDTALVTLHPTGVNTFIVPTRDDTVWYDGNKIICTIPEPTKLSSRGRFVSVDTKIWCSIYT